MWLSEELKLDTVCGVYPHFVLLSFKTLIAEADAVCDWSSIVILRGEISFDCDEERKSFSEPPSKESVSSMQADADLNPHQ